MSNEPSVFVELTFDDELDILAGNAGTWMSQRKWKMKTLNDLFFTSFPVSAALYSAMGIPKDIITSRSNSYGQCNVVTIVALHKGNILPAAMLNLVLDPPTTTQTPAINIVDVCRSPLHRGTGEKLLSFVLRPDNWSQITQLFPSSLNPNNLPFFVDSKAPPILSTVAQAIQSNWQNLGKDHSLLNDQVTHLNVGRSPSGRTIQYFERVKHLSKESLEFEDEILKVLATETIPVVERMSLLNHNPWFLNQLIELFILTFPFSAE